MTPSAPLKLRGEDADDLAVISACLQDSLFAVGEMAFDSDGARFAALLTRSRIDEAAGADRVKTAIHFEAVRAVKYRGIDRTRPDRRLALIGIFAEPGRNRPVVRLLFHEGAELWLEVERIFCFLQDLQPPRAESEPPAPGDGESAS